MADIEKAAEALWAARRERKPIPALRTSFALEAPTDAYAVQEICTQRAIADGRQICGRKIGLTSVAVQQQLGVSEPDFGMLWADTRFVGPAALNISDFMQPRVEAELAFVLERDLTAERIELHDLIGAIAYVVPALEIVDSAIENWDIRLVDTIADNASGAAFVTGASPRKLSEIDLRLCGMVTSQGGRDVSVGTGAACLGNPLFAALWLARKMVEVGRPLAAGEIILSGALGPMVAATQGDDFLVEIAGFAPFSARFV